MKSGGKPAFPTCETTKLSDGSRLSAVHPNLRVKLTKLGVGKAGLPPLLVRLPTDSFGINQYSLISGILFPPSIN
jgi:hypothetical protein